MAISLNHFTGVRFVEGKLGDGKTYSAVLAMARHIGEGLTVFTNVEIHREGMARYVAERFGVVMEQSQLIQIEGLDEFYKLSPAGVRGATVLGVFDETHLFANSRTWQKNSAKVIEFLTQCRKQFTSVIIISQDASTVDKQFRVLAGSFVGCKNLGKWTIPLLGVGYAAFVRLITFGASSGKHILLCHYDSDAVTMLGREWVCFDPLLGAAYNSEAILVEIQRAGTVERKTLEKVSASVVPAESSKFMRTLKNNRAAFTLITILVPLGLVLLGWFAWRRWKGKEETPAVPAVAAAVPASSSGVLPVLSSGVEKPISRLSASGPRLSLFVERFVGFYGVSKKPILKTENASYELGEMSQRGFVRAVSDRRAVVFDGVQNSWVIAEEPTVQEVRESALAALRDSDDRDRKEFERIERIDMRAERQAKTRNAEWAPRPSELGKSVDAARAAEFARPLSADTFRK